MLQIRVQLCHQGAGCCGCGDGAVHNLAVAEFLSVQISICVTILPQSSSLQRYTCENAPGPGPRKNLSRELRIRLRRGVASNRTCGYLTFASECELAGK